MVRKLLLSEQCVHTIKAAVFEGTSQNEFKDRKEFSGSLFKQMEEAYGTGMKENEEVEKKVIALTKERGIFTRKEIEQILDISQTTCGRLLKRMSMNGQILQEGRGKNTHYRLLK